MMQLSLRGELLLVGGVCGVVVRGVVVRAGDPVVVAVAEGGVVGLEPVLLRLLLHLELGTVEIVRYVIG